MIQVIGVILTIIVISGWQALVQSVTGLYWKVLSLFSSDRREEENERGEDGDGSTQD